MGYPPASTATKVQPGPRLIKRPSDNVTEARDAFGHLVAHYNPRTNETRNCRGDLIGKGNRLATVLKSIETGKSI